MRPRFDGHTALTPQGLSQGLSSCTRQLHQAGQPAVSGFSVGPAIAHPKGSGILARSLSSPADLREGWVSPRTPQMCRKNEPNFWVDLVPLGSLRIGPQVQNHCHLWLPGTGWVSTVDEPHSQSTCCRSSLCLGQLFLQKTQPADCIPPPNLSTLGLEGTGLQWHRETWWPSHLQELALEEPRPLGFLGNHIPPPLYPHSFFIPGGIQEEASTVALSAETCLLE